MKLTAFAVIFAGAPAAVLAQNGVAFTNGPIAITSFQIDESYSTGIIGTELEQAPQLSAENVRVRFTNTGTLPATTVKFLVGDDRAKRIIVDKGTFSPGVQIDHSFATGDGKDVHPNVTCSVAEVDFVDGSTWHAAPDDFVVRQAPR